jgi:N-acetylneuraminate synthase
MKSIKLANKTYNNNSLPYVIAEIGVNHHNSLKEAKRMILSAKNGGATGVKFQTYKAEKIAAKDSPYYWDLKMEPSTNQFDFFKKWDQFSDNDYIECSKYANSIGIDFLSTPFDSDAIDFLDPMVPFHKISSSDITNTPFLRHIASKKKPVILSTGASTLLEIGDAVETLYSNNCDEVILLQCILNYPTKFVNANLNMMNSLASEFPDCHIGLSDHTLADENMLVLTTAYTMGARVIEKHYTSDKTIKGGDHLHSMDEDDLSKLTSNIAFVQSLLGSELKEPLKSEDLARKNARRSIVIKNELNKGDIIFEKDITYKRPASGVCTSHWDEVIGRTVCKDLKFDHILQWSDLEQA